jgi:hypothetical protein
MRVVAFMDPGRTTQIGCWSYALNRVVAQLPTELNQLHYCPLLRPRAHFPFSHFADDKIGQPLQGQKNQDHTYDGS